MFLLVIWWMLIGGYEYFPITGWTHGQLSINSLDDHYENKPMQIY